MNGFQRPFKTYLQSSSESDCFRSAKVFYLEGRRQNADHEQIFTSSQHGEKEIE